MKLDPSGGNVDEAHAVCANVLGLGRGLRLRLLGVGLLLGGARFLLLQDDVLFLLGDVGLGRGCAAGTDA